MSEDLKELFDKRNREILGNKIKLDIDNNTDSLKLTISNVIMLEMNKLSKSIVNFCVENKIFCDKDKINELIEEEKKKLEEIVISRLGKRKDDFDNLKDTEIDNETEVLRKLTDNMIEEIKTNIFKENAINFLPNITNNLNLKNEEDLVRLNGLLRLGFNTISNRIENNTRTRFINLCNMIEESRQISKEYSKKTGDAIEKISSSKKDKKTKKSVKKMIKKAS